MILLKVVFITSHRFKWSDLKYFKMARVPLCFGNDGVWTLYRNIESKTFKHKNLEERFLQDVLKWRGQFCVFGVTEWGCFMRARVNMRGSGITGQTSQDFIADTDWKPTMARLYVKKDLMKLTNRSLCGITEQTT